MTFLLVGVKFLFMRIIYWLSTVLFLIPTAGSGVLEILKLGPAGSAETMARLGYPPFLMPLLAGAKILGAAAILSNVSPRLTEWAYAGFCFLLIGAAWSHFSVGDTRMPFFPLALLVLVFISYRSRTRR